MYRLPILDYGLPLPLNQQMAYLKFKLHVCGISGLVESSISMGNIGLPHNSYLFTANSGDPKVDAYHVFIILQK